MDIPGIIDKIVSHAMSLGIFDVVNQYEPTSAPGTGLTCAIWIQQIGPDRRNSGMASVSARLAFNVRVFTSMFTGPPDAIDPKVINAIDQLMAAYAGDFTLDTTIRCVDLLGMSGVPLSAEAGYINQDNQYYRVMTITLPLLVNDVWTEAP